MLCTRSIFNLHLADDTNSLLKVYLVSTPISGCREDVVWTVFKEPIKISYRQLKRFWRINTDTGSIPDEPLINNFRPNQPLNGREVIYADLELECRHHEEWRQDYFCDISYK